LPFGEEIPQGSYGRDTTYPTGAYPSGTLDTQAVKFTGKERDAETGLDYFGARYYSGGQGRFMTPDWSAEPEPVPYADFSDPQSLNLYAYVRNDPLTNRDLDGHYCFFGVIGTTCQTTPTSKATLGAQGKPILGLGGAVNAVGQGIGKVSDFLNTAPGVGLVVGMAMFAETGGGDETPAVAEAAEGLEAAASKAITATEQGIAKIEDHLSQFGEWGPNTAMIGRLKDAVANGGRLSGADANFYLHELAESTMMEAGQSYEAAHAAALLEYGHSPYSLYAPDVVNAFTHLFNANWRNFWGIK
jgi:RHS repeat-associated protein